MLKVLGITLIVILLIPILLIIFLIITYNSLVRRKQLVKEAWSGIEVQLKRRADLIPNLVNVVKGFAKHEKEVFESITKARAKTLGAGNVKDKAKAEAELSRALRGLFEVVENYPELKSDRNFMHLQKTLAQIEDEIQLARRYYNATVRDYNTLIESFPAVLLARPLGFRREDYFDMDTSAFIEGRTAEEQRRPPDVEF